MRIAIVIEKFYPTAGGNERSTHQIASRLIARGHAVTVLTNRGEARGDVLPGGAVVRADGLGTQTAVGIWWFRRWAQKEIDRGGFDVSLSVTTAVPATVVQPRGGTALETQRRNAAMRSTPFKRFLKRAEQAITSKRLALLMAERATLNSPRVKRFAAVSRYVADQLVHDYTVPFRRIAVIPNAAEVHRFDGAERAARRTHTRHTLGLHDDDVVFFFAAMNPGLKGLPFLLRSLAALRERRGDKAGEPGAKLIVAGSLDLGSQRAAKRLGVRDVVTFTGPTSEIDTLYAASDVTVLPTWYDPSSKVVLESLLHGVPAISTLYNGASQWIFSPTGEADIPSPFGSSSAAQLVGPAQMAGRVIDSPSNVEAMTEAMAQLCDAEERAACAEATAGLESRISMDAHVDQLEALLKEVAG
ncbi:MAG: glycosyltransferase [Phycisphaera sp.]|nr:glycosyltransferase [Phycisphaera sp.]